MDDVQLNGSNYNVNTSEHFETLMADLQNAAVLESGEMGHSESGENGQF